MINFEELVLVNYCYADCVPMMNIMRLPEEDAFRLARELAEKHPDTTAFYRFADFEHYYRLRKNQDAALHARFIELGGCPETGHPLSFVVEGSDYLREWFGNGIETRLPLKCVDPRHISFTVGDSGSTFQNAGKLDLLTLDALRELAGGFGGDFAAFVRSTGRNYVEAQLWSERYADRYLTDR